MTKFASALLHKFEIKVDDVLFCKRFCTARFLDLQCLLTSVDGYRRDITSIFNGYAVIPPTPGDPLRTPWGPLGDPLRTLGDPLWIP